MIRCPASGLFFIYLWLFAITLDNQYDAIGPKPEYTSNLKSCFRMEVEVQFSHPHQRQTTKTNMQKIESIKTASNF
ncbi:MAG: hypothetical protein COB24_12415 [Hyphomicrobiales bacterium]|nr:MAG: hypothetical protein COB24_12415 [Hyphomicrobiales bacterium]